MPHDSEMKSVSDSELKPVILEAVAADPNRCSKDYLLMLIAMGENGCARRPCSFHAKKSRNVTIVKVSNF